MPQQKKSPEELRDLYREEYVGVYRKKDTRRIARILSRLCLRPNATAVDIGCGNGMLLDLLKGRIRAYHGVDFSSEFIAEARRRHPETEGVVFHCESINDFCRRHPKRFDYAFALDFAEHVYDEELVDILASVRESLRPDGRLYLHTPNLDFIIEQMKDRGLLRQFPEHVAVGNFPQYEKLLRQAGFSGIRRTDLPHYVAAVSWVHFFSYLPWIGRYFRARLLLECVP